MLTPNKERAERKENLRTHYRQQKQKDLTCAPIRFMSPFSNLTPVERIREPALIAKT